MPLIQLPDQLPLLLVQFSLPGANMVQLSFFTIITALVACGLAAPHRHHFGQTSNSTSVSTPPSSISPIAPASSSISSSSTSSSTTSATGSIDPTLVPDFGITVGVASSTPNNCVGNNGVLIPCTCPPDRDAFVQKVGEAVAGGAAFPEGESTLLTFVPRTVC